MRDISLYLSTIPDYNQMLAGKNVLITCLLYTSDAADE